MIASAHIVAGAVAGMAGARLARGTRGVVLAFVFGIVTHHILDAIPHSDYAGLSPIAITVVGGIEALVSVGFIVLGTRGRLSREELRCLAAGMVGGIAMDVKGFAPLLPGLREPIQQLQDALHPFHAPAHDRRLLGLGLELAMLALCSWILVLQVRALSRRNERPR